MASNTTSAASGRCAGPLAADLSGVALAVKRSGGRYPTYETSGTRAFAAGPYTGTLESTLVVRSAPASSQSGGLPNTGADVLGVASLAGVLLIGGVFLLVQGRRRHS